MASNSFSSSLFSAPSSSGDDSKTEESDDFRRLLVQLADELEDAEDDIPQKIRFLYKNKLGRGKSKLSTLGMLERLEEKGVFSADDLEPLEELMKNVGRHDLINDYVKPYRTVKRASQSTQVEDSQNGKGAIDR